MSPHPPRSYRLGRRQTAIARTRTKVLRAARELLAGKGDGECTLDDVARRAGVTRMTVYNQFKSRRGLLEAVFDSFAQGGELPQRLGAAFSRGNPDEVLAGVIDAFASFWAAGRKWIRRVRALGVLDPELGEAIEARNDRRRRAMRAVLERMGPRYEQAELVGVLYALTSFETFDTLAGPRARLEDAASVVLQLARAYLKEVQRSSRPR